jgi:hypothetical protein
MGRSLKKFRVDFSDRVDIKIDNQMGSENISDLFTYHLNIFFAREKNSSIFAVA